jgi:hypothetical protein
LARIAGSAWRFVYEQREEDVVLQALVRKTELIRTQLGSAGQVIVSTTSP